MNVIPQNMHWIGLREVFHTNLRSIWWGEPWFPVQMFPFTNRYIHPRVAACRTRMSKTSRNRRSFKSSTWTRSGAEKLCHPKMKILKIAQCEQLKTCFFQNSNVDALWFLCVQQIHWTSPELSGLAPFSYTGFRDVIQNRDADRLWICKSSILDQILLSAIYGLIHSDIDMPTCAH